MDDASTTDKLNQVSFGKFWSNKNETLRHFFRDTQHGAGANGGEAILIFTPVNFQAINCKRKKTSLDLKK